MRRGLIRSVETAIRDERLLSTGDTIVVAVSGGPDSMTLLHILYSLSSTWGWRLVAAHVNHNLRGEESDREAETVKRFAAELNLRCEIGSVNVYDRMREAGESVQVAARKMRYEYLREIAGKHAAGHIALAHHADDQAETVLMRIIGGTGPSGLAGIHPLRGDHGVMLVRPLLRTYKSDIEMYVTETGIPACRDSSNDSRVYFRNEIRLDVIPFLSKYNPQLSESLGRMAAIIRDENEYIYNEAVRTLPEIAELANGEAVFAAEAFLSCSVALQRRWIQLILEYVSAHSSAGDYIDVETVRQAAMANRPGSVRFDLSGGLIVRKEYGRVSVVRRSVALSSNYEYALERSLPDQLYVPEANVMFTFGLAQDDGERPLPRARDQSSALFDMDELSFPLVIRNRKPGDRISWPGLSGSKKLQDLFVDEKVPRSKRDEWPLLVDSAGHIIWVPGLRRSAAAQVSERTKRQVYVKMTQLAPDRHSVEC